MLVPPLPLSSSLRSRLTHLRSQYSAHLRVPVSSGLFGTSTTVIFDVPISSSPGVDDTDVDDAKDEKPPPSYGGLSETGPTSSPDSHEKALLTLAPP